VEEEGVGSRESGIGEEKGQEPDGEAGESGIGEEKGHATSGVGNRGSGLGKEEAQRRESGVRKKEGVESEVEGKSEDQKQGPSSSPAPDYPLPTPESTPDYPLPTPGSSTPDSPPPTPDAPSASPAPDSGIRRAAVLTAAVRTPPLQCLTSAKSPPPLGTGSGSSNGGRGGSAGR
jgi:hypothetical protein